MKYINIRGDIIPNDLKDVYGWFGMDATCPKDIEQALKDAAGDEVTISINSYGGDVASGNEIYYLLSQYNARTVADISGFACSAASYIALAADIVRMVPSASFMIHNVSGIAAGDHNAMTKEAKALQSIGNGIAQVYASKTGKTVKEMLKLMEEETWLNAQEAFELGFVDEVITAEPCYTNGLRLSDEAINKARAILAEKKLADNSTEKATICKAKLNLIKMRRSNVYGS